MLIVIFLLKLLAALAAIKNNLKVAGYFLLGNLGLDVLGQIIKHFQHYPKPYTGLGFILFSLTTFCYLANGAWLLFCAGWAVQNKTLKQVAGLALLTMLSFVLLMYPTLHGATMLTVWYAFYATLGITSLAALVKDLRKNLNFSTALMLMLSLGCVVEIGMIILFGFPYYWLVSVCNCIFYLVVLGVCAIAPNYIHLLKP